MNPRSPIRPHSRSRPALALTLMLAVALTPHVGAADVADTEPIALELLFEPGATPCFSTAALASEVEQRLGQPVSNAPVDTPALSVFVRVRAAVSGFDVTIESRARDSAETGQRELLVEGGCENLAAPLSLVIALLAGTSVATPAPAQSQPAPAAQPVSPPAAPPAPPPAAAPVPPPAAPRRDEPVAARQPSASDRHTGIALSASGGVDLAIAPSASALASVAARLDIERLRRGSGSYLGITVAGEFLSSSGNRHEGATFSFGGTGVHAQLCAIWKGAWFSLEPSFGFWVRSLAVKGDHDDGSRFQSANFAMFGWSTGAAARAHISGPWSVFAGVQGLVPFGDTTFLVERLPQDDRAMALGDEPFFNADGEAVAPIVGAPLTPERIKVHETPVLTTVLLAGVTFAP